MYNKQQYKNVRHQATRRAQKWLNKLRHLDAIQVLFISVANETPVCCLLKFSLKELGQAPNRKWGPETDSK